MPDADEFGLIDRIHQVTGPTTATLGIGDDAAAFKPSAGYLQLVTVDMLVDGVHFQTARAEAEQIGYQAMAVSLSDIAAMGGEPRYALVSLAVPPSTTTRWIERMYHGMKSLCGEFAVSVVGGNVTRTSGPLCIDVVLTGEVHEDDILRRSGAMVGDAVVITGTLGNPAAARRYLEANGSAGDLGEWSSRARPAPRVQAGQVLAQSHLVHAMMDISDGLGSDIRHLCRASGVEVILHEELLPVTAQARAVAEEFGLDPSQLALFGGEDYELLFTCYVADIPELQNRVGSLPLHLVGSIVPRDEGFVLERKNGSRQMLSDDGWKHF